MRRTRFRPCPRRSARSARSRGGRRSRSSATPTRSSAASSTWRARPTLRSWCRWPGARIHPATWRRAPTRTWRRPSSVRGGCDAILLALHGAMVAEHLDDGEGELLRRLRAVALRTPIAVGLDFHSHMTAAMVDNATIITGYRTYPHIDMADTAQRAGRTLLRVLRGEVEPVMVWGARAMMTSTLVHTPSRQPMRDIMDMAIAAET